MVATTAESSELAVAALTLKDPGLFATVATAAVAMVTAFSTTACWAGVREETACALPPLADSETWPAVIVTGSEPGTEDWIETEPVPVTTV